MVNNKSGENIRQFAWKAGSKRSNSTNKSSATKHEKSGEGGYLGVPLEVDGSKVRVKKTLIYPIYK